MTIFTKCLLCAASVLLAACAAKANDDEAAAKASRAPPVPPLTPGGVISPEDSLSDRTFYVQSLGARCLDFGGQAWWAVGAPVIIYSCNGTIAQQVRVKEIDASHDVELRVQCSSASASVEAASPRVNPWSYRHAAARPPSDSRWTATRSSWALRRRVR